MQSSSPVTVGLPKRRTLDAAHHPDLYRVNLIYRNKINVFSGIQGAGELIDSTPFEGCAPHCVLVAGYVSNFCSSEWLPAGRDPCAAWSGGSLRLTRDCGSRSARDCGLGLHLQRFERFAGQGGPLPGPNRSEKRDALPSAFLGLRMFSCCIVGHCKRP